MTGRRASRNVAVMNTLMSHALAGFRVLRVRPVGVGVAERAGVVRIAVVGVARVGIAAAA